MAATQRTAGIAAADAVFILAASTFFFCGHQFGLQRNGKTVRFPGELAFRANTALVCVATTSLQVQGQARLLYKLGVYVVF